MTNISQIYIFCLMKPSDLGPGATGALSEGSGYNLTQLDFFLHFMRVIPIYDKLYSELLIRPSYIIT